MNFKDHFSGGSALYAKFRPTYGRQLFAWLSELVPSRSLAWDCATGNGQAALPLAEFFDHVVATDASAKQIQNAPPNPKIEYRVAAAAKSGLEIESCELITVAQALHWFDVPAFYAEASRVLKPKGILAAWSYNLLRINPEIDAVVRQFYTDIVGPYWPSERRIVENGYRDLAFPFPELPAPEFFVSAEWSAASLLGFLGTWSATEKYRQVQGQDPIRLIEDEIRQLWPGNESRRKIQWPLAIRIGRKP